MSLSLSGGFQRWVTYLFLLTTLYYASARHAFSRHHDFRELLQAEAVSQTCWSVALLLSSLMVQNRVL